MTGRLGALATRLWLLALAGGLTGCTLADRYSGHAVVYNIEAEQAQNQALLLNVVRAYLRRPMQFTSLESITGTTTVNQSASIFVPFTHLRTETPTGTFDASVSHGPSYTVPVLDTQEFYQGILNPVPGQLIDLYVQQGYSRDLIYNLFLQKIVVRRTDCPLYDHSHDCELTFRNYVMEDLDLELFQALLGYLITLGLTTEPSPEPPKKGSDSTDQPRKASTRLAGDPPTGGLDLANDLSDSELVAASKPKKGGDSGDDGGGDDSTPKLKPYRFCFAPRERQFYPYVKLGVLCDNPASGIKSKRGKTTLDGVNIAPIAGYLNAVVQAQLRLDERRKLEDHPVSGAEGFRSIQTFVGHLVSLQFYTRSSEGIIYYLGEVARRQLLRDDHGKMHRFVEFRSGPPSAQFPIRPCPFVMDPDVQLLPDSQGYTCHPIFILEENSGGPAALAVPYEGVYYSVPSPSMSVLSFTRQVLAVNTSAKQLPASSVLRVVGR